MSYQELCNKYYDEYKKMCTPKKAQSDAANWDRGDKKLKSANFLEKDPQIILEIASDYADYVTTKVCKHEKEIIIAYADSLDGVMHGCNGSCAFGNAAYLILLLDKYPEKAEFKKQMTSAFIRQLRIFRSA